LVVELGVAVAAFVIAMRVAKLMRVTAPMGLLALLVAFLLLGGGIIGLLQHFLDPLLNSN
jgi:hypothetical protein